MATQCRWPRRPALVLCVARLDEPSTARQMRTSTAQLDDAVRRAAIYEYSIRRVDDPAARNEAMVATRLPMGSSMTMDAMAKGSRDEQRCSA